MIKKLNTLNEELNRIKELIGLNEQDNKSIGVIQSFNGDDLEIFKVFDKYLKEKFPITDDLLVEERYKKLLSLNENDFIDIIEFFKINGYDSKKDDIKNKIIHYQKSPIINVKEYINKNNLKNKFDDGIFGVATAMATLNKKILPDMKLTIESHYKNEKMYNDKPKPFTYGLIRQRQKYANDVAKKEGGYQNIKPKETKTSNINISNIGTQSIK